MIKHLISAEGRFYKANLHSHSTVSDGEKSPQELKEMYLAHGYSILAYTDHNRFVIHNELSDDGFLALNGVEESADERTGVRWHDRCCDLNFIAAKAAPAADRRRGERRPRLRSLPGKLLRSGRQQHDPHRARKRLFRHA